MLGQTEGMATLAVKDLATAAKFYEGVLGLKRAGTESDQVIAYQTGKTTLMVYLSSFAGTNKATAVTFTVGDELERIVQAIEAKGVTFEHYDGMPETTRMGAIHVAGGVKVAWVKDPDGNIISLVKQ